MKISSLWEYLLNILFGALYLALSAGLLLILVFIFVYLKRWYGRARISRSEKDFEKVGEYIVGTGKKINFFQRKLLSQTGEIISFKFFLLILLSSIVLFLIIYLGDTYLVSMFTEITLRKIMIPLIIFIELYDIIVWIFSLKSLIQYARLVPFIIFSACLFSWSAFMITYIW